MEELNKKLAEWAGFKFYGEKAVGIGFRHNVWESPLREDGWLFNELPNFIHSLDACFKWLVPKLDRVEVVLNEAPSGDVFWNATANTSKVTSETPALALCRAIEKLIDGEKDA